MVSKHYKGSTDTAEKSERNENIKGPLLLKSKDFMSFILEIRFTFYMYSCKKKYVNPLGLLGFLHKLVIKYVLIFI